MVFSSLIFLFAFLPITLLLYFATPFKSLKYKNFILFTVSLVFYGWGEPKYIIIMLFSILTAYIFGFYIGKYRDIDKKKARMYLVISLLLNLAFLLFFKYANFFLDNIAVLPFLSGIKQIANLTLPIGISFYTFQIMSYSIDLYRGETETQRSFVAFGAYVVLFPQLIAGPIVRYRDIDDMLIDRKETVDKFASGAVRFCAGLAKKVILADSAAAVVEYFRTANEFKPSVLGTWTIVLAYTFQIYFDFSGYSDMAIGLGRIIGFEFLENFDFPYISRSITEFWRRWHISLSTWFKEYVYIPLGGNRKGLWMQYRNIAIVWLLTGFWHGAAWNFVIWGAYFGVILMVEKTFLLKVLDKLPRFVGHIYTVILIMFGWLIFSSTSLSQIWLYSKLMIGINATFTTTTVTYDFVRLLPLFVVCIIASTPFAKRSYDWLIAKYSSAAYLNPLLTSSSLLLCTAYMVDSTFSPFLYYIF
ncbi:MAG: transcriptional regulator [Clostridiales bacterium GWF2_36_10]|nr:MAG: transcriptional regulator [Clostridiales bacterium GWF2_36_10]HAN21432.1 transcriptional regulator [Clostridiales bacterium]